MHAQRRGWYISGSRLLSLGILALSCFVSAWPAHAADPASARPVLTAGRAIAVIEQTIPNQVIIRHGTSLPGGVTGFPLDTTAFPVVLNVEVFLIGWTEYNTFTCQVIDTGTWKVTTAPLHGTLRFGIENHPVSSGPCTGFIFAFNVAHYTWTDATSDATQDFFSLLWFTADGQFTDPSDWLAELLCPAPSASVTSVTVTTNENCNPDINPVCTPNIVLANGVEYTKVTTQVEPVQAVSVDLSTTFGSVEDAQTDSSGKAISVYTSGVMTSGSTDTKIGTLSATTCGQEFPNLRDIFNYYGFNFHTSQVTDQTFTDSTAMNRDTIQTFFEARGSFLAKFILVGTIGGFLDMNGNGTLDSDEPTYSATGTPIPLGSTGPSAATIFFNKATEKGINPKLLIATAEKEQSLITEAPSTMLPSLKRLNGAMGCALNQSKLTNFVAQIGCAAKALSDHFHETSAFNREILYPFFFHATDGMRHYVTGLGRKYVGFEVTTAATYAQFRYTPHIQSLPNGGGVYRFELVWQRFGF